MSALFLASEAAPVVRAPCKDPPHPPLGILVRVTRGRLAGLTGRVLKSSAGMYLIEVSLLGRGVYLRIESQLLEPVEVT